MTETNKHAWLKGVSVEIKKGNVDLKIGPKATAPAPATTTQVVPTPAPSHPPSVFMGISRLGISSGVGGISDNCWSCFVEKIGL